MRSDREVYPKHAQWEIIFLRSGREISLKHARREVSGLWKASVLRKKACAKKGSFFKAYAPQEESTFKARAVRGKWVDKNTHCVSEPPMLKIFEMLSLSNN